MIVAVKDLDRYIKEKLRSKIKFYILQTNSNNSCSTDTDIRKVIDEQLIRELKDDVKDYYKGIFPEEVNCRLSADDCVNLYNKYLVG